MVDSRYPEPSEHYGALQEVIDDLFEPLEDPDAEVKRLQVVLAAESADLPEELQEVVGLLPPGSYTRERLCVQLNSSITGHGWGLIYGTVA